MPAETPLQPTPDYNLLQGEHALQALIDRERRVLGQIAAGVPLAEVLSDLPGTSRIELAHELRQLYPALAVVLSSGYSHVLAESGADGFELLHKPYSVEQLSRVLRKAVRG